MLAGLAMRPRLAVRCWLGLRTRLAVRAGLGVWAGLGRRRRIAGCYWLGMLP
jgi:hypothetical protein